MRNIAIIGVGVSGLTTGIELLIQGYNVTIHAQQLNSLVTSNIAAAIWSPFKIEPIQKAEAWSLTSLAKFKQLALTNPESGIMFKCHSELFSEKVAKPSWMEHLEAITQPDYIPREYKKFSYSVKIPIIDTTKYMPYLKQWYLSLGGNIIEQSITDIKSLLNDYHIVVNCSGVGAHKLCNDGHVFPIRGHVLAIKKPSNFDDSIVRGNNLAHIISRTDDCLIGGTVDENIWDTEPKMDTRLQIIAKVKEIYSNLGEVTILKEMVGLRPGRTQVRLEIEPIDSKHAIIHNYGHGGSGFTVSWGCAAEVSMFVREFL